VTTPLRARPCPICEAESTPGVDRGVVGIYRESVFADHCLEHHPGFDWRSAWEMPMPARRPRLEPVR
jgi:hypothetical protein